MAGDDTKSSQGQSDRDYVPHIRKEDRPDFDASRLPHKQLPKELQDTLDNDEKMWATLYEGKASDSTESDVRYAAYAARVKTILRSAHRYVAYTSDIGESFRPIAHPWLIKGAYGVSWAYLAGDVANEGRKAYVRNQAALNPEAAPPSAEDVNISPPSSLAKVEAKVKDAASSSYEAAKSLATATPGAIAPLDDYRTVMAQRAIFQSVASMGLPAFTIHSIVKYSGRYLKKASNKTIRTYGPIGLGLAAVPFLPFMFDEPVEKAVEWTFHQGFEALGMASPEHVPIAAGVPAGESKKEL